jgi:hypothetical protein
MTVKPAVWFAVNSNANLAVTEDHTQAPQVAHQRNYATKRAGAEAAIAAGYLFKTGAFVERGRINMPSAATSLYKVSMRARKIEIANTTARLTRI